jgi:hypothetical protein
VHDRLRGGYALQRWGTPRAKSAGDLAAIGLLDTMRSIGVLVNQFRFEDGTPGRFGNDRCNPEYVEWMVGLPRGWTDAPMEE